MPISEKDTAIGRLVCLGETGKETIGKNPSGSGQTSNTNLGKYPFKKSEFFLDISVEQNQKIFENSEAISSQ